MSAFNFLQHFPLGYTLTSDPKQATHVWDFDGSVKELPCLYSRSLKGWLIKETQEPMNINTKMKKTTTLEYNLPDGYIPIQLAEGAKATHVMDKDGEVKPLPCEYDADFSVLLVMEALPEEVDLPRLPLTRITYMKRGAPFTEEWSDAKTHFLETQPFLFVSGWRKGQSTEKHYKLDLVESIEVVY